MTLRALIRKPKTITDVGEWKAGKMPKTAFPLSKARHYRLGDGWRWRVIHFESDGGDFRLLIALHEGKQNACALLGEVIGDDNTKVIVALETHSTHPGWHVHANCGLTGTTAGRLRDPDMKRIPDNPGSCKPHGALLIHDDVLARAATLFRLPSLGYGAPSDTPGQSNLFR